MFSLLNKYNVDKDLLIDGLVFQGNLFWNDSPQTRQKDGMNVSKFGVNIGYRGIGIWSVSGTSSAECHVSDLYEGKQRHRRRKPLDQCLSFFSYCFDQIL